MSVPPLSYERFVDLLADTLMAEPDRIAPDTLLVEELGLQSIDVVHLVEQVEMELDTDLTGIDIGEVDTVEELYWELVTGGDDGGDSVVAGMASLASSSEGLPHEVALRRWLPDDPMADVDTLPGLIHRRAAVTPDRVYVHHEGRDLTYRELAKQVARVAAALQAQGVQRGDRVILVMANSFEFFAAFYAVQHLRAVAVPLFHVPQPDRIARITQHCEAKVIIGLRPFARIMQKRIVRELGGEGPILNDMASLLTEPTPAGVQLPMPEPDDLAMLQYTSGTTGAAKGVMLTHRALVANLRQAIPKAEFTDRDVFVSWLPVYHDMGLITMTMCPMYLGAKLVLLPVRLSADAWLTAIETHEGTVTAAPDFAYRYVLRVGGNLERYDISTMRMALVAAEPVRARTIARFEAELGIPGVLRPGYGLAESCVAVAFYPLDREQIDVDADGFIACGTPVPGTELSIRDDAGRVLPPGEPGEVCSRSPSQTIGYFRNPEATKNLFTSDHFVRTGDIGYLNAEGMLTIVDRKKNIIIVSGRNMSPKELEEVVDTLPEVTLAMAVGLDTGGDAGEQVQMVVEVTEREPDAALQRTVGRAVRGLLQEQMGVRVQKVQVVPRGTIPRTYNGKLQYTVMKQRIQRNGQAKEA
jgi:acyl-CoA synthetase (AMP-forming)/AMP-acid ligase II/acyl carrier protein